MPDKKKMLGILDKVNLLLGGDPMEMQGVGGGFQGETEADPYGLEDEERAAIMDTDVVMDESGATQPKRGLDILKEVLADFGVERAEIEAKLKGLPDLKDVGKTEKTQAQEEFDIQFPELNAKQKVLTAISNAFVAFGSPDTGATGAQILSEMAQNKRERFAARRQVGIEAEDRAREVFKGEKERLEGRFDELDKLVKSGQIGIGEAQLEVEKEATRAQNEMFKVQYQEQQKAMRAQYEQNQQMTRKYMDLIGDEHLKQMEIDGRQKLETYKQGRIDWRLKEAGEDAMLMDLINMGVDGGTSAELAQHYRTNPTGTPPPQHLIDRLTKAQNEMKLDKNNFERTVNSNRVNLWKQLKGKPYAIVGGDPDATDPAKREAHLVFGAEKDALDMSTMAEFEKGVQTMMYRQLSGSEDYDPAAGPGSVLDPKFVDQSNTTVMIYRELLNQLGAVDPKDRAALDLAKSRITGMRQDIIDDSSFSQAEKYELLRRMDQVNAEFGLARQDEITAANERMGQLGGLATAPSH